MDNKFILDSAVSAKKFLPMLISNLKDCFEINLTIKLFGVTVFTFSWPPKVTEEMSNH